MKRREDMDQVCSESPLNRDFVEVLPLEILCEVAKYLTARDLSACCGVSRSWRDTFGHDAFWQNQCDTSLEEYLRTTPCEVEPAFVSPEGEGSSLSPVGRWRMAFLREIHLYKNWETANYKTKAIEFNPKDILYREHHFIFLGIDSVFIIMRAAYDLVDVWRLSGDRMTRSASRCMFPYWDESVNDDVVLFGCASAMQVITLDQAANDIVTKHLFFFHESQKIAANDFLSFKDKFDNQRYPFAEYAVVGTVFIGGFKNMPSSLHIWDIEGGIKLKEEKCPLENCILVKVVHSRSSEFVAVQYDDSVNKKQFLENGNFRNQHVLVYDPKKFTFLSFHYYTHNADGIDFALHKEYIAVYHREKKKAMIDVHNVISSQHIFQCVQYYRPDIPGHLGVVDEFIVFGRRGTTTLGVVDEFFVFNHQGTTTLFYPTSKRRLTIPGSYFVCAINNKLLKLKMSHDFNKFTYVWKEKKIKFKSLSKESISQPLNSEFFINPTCTTFYEYRRQVCVSHRFW